LDYFVSKKNSHLSVQGLFVEVCSGMSYTFFKKQKNKKNTDVTKTGAEQKAK
jgi:hypothetical protein